MCLCISYRPKMNFYDGHFFRLGLPFVLFFYDLLSEVSHKRGTFIILNLPTTTPFGDGELNPLLCPKVL